MFVQSARTVAEHGQSPTERLARMNLAVHGLEGDIRQAITYYENPHELLGRADFVMSSQASSAGGEAKISRRRLVETGDVDVVIAILLELLLHAHRAVRAAVPEPSQARGAAQLANRVQAQGAKGPSSSRATAETSRPFSLRRWRLFQKRSRPSVWTPFWGSSWRR